MYNVVSTCKLYLLLLTIVLGDEWLLACAHFPFKFLPINSLIQSSAHLAHKRAGQMKWHRRLLQLPLVGRGMFREKNFFKSRYLVCLETIFSKRISNLGLRKIK